MASVRKLVENCRPLERNNQSLPVCHFQHTSGKHEFYVGNAVNATTSRVKAGRNVNRLSYRIFGDEAMLLGISVEQAQRGKGLGQAMLGYFQDEMEARGLTPCETATINKPLIALLLTRSGLKPLHVGACVEILPRPASAGSQLSYVPDVHLLSQPAGLDLVTGNGREDYYRVIDPEIVQAKYPIGSQDSVVTIHTPYIFPDSTPRAM